MKNYLVQKLIFFCVLLLITRIILTQHFTFTFLLWNLFLAWLPIYFINQFYKQHSKYNKALLFLLAVLFLPNAPYIVTDLFHLQSKLVAPMWLDVVLILSFAICGLYFFFKTLKAILNIVYDSISKSHWLHFFVKLLMMVLSAYGVYLGRYLRFNSWDILFNPLHLFQSIFHSIFSVDCFKETFGVTITFAIFFYLLYELYEQATSKNQQENVF